MTALASSNNPASATNLAPATSEACEFLSGVGGPCTLVWSHLGGSTTMQCTLTNVDTATDAAYWMIVEIAEFIP